MGDIGESGNAVLQTIQASEGGRALRLLRQRQRMRQRMEEEKQKIESKGLKRRNLTFGGSSADRLEDEFKKETIGLLTAQAFKEKRARLEEQIRVEQRSLFPQKLQEKRRMELSLTTSKLSFGDSEEADEVLVQAVDKAFRATAAEAAAAAAAAVPAPAPVSAASHHASLQQQQSTADQLQQAKKKEERSLEEGREGQKMGEKVKAEERTSSSCSAGILGTAAATGGDPAVVIDSTKKEVVSTQRSDSQKNGGGGAAAAGEADSISSGAAATASSASEDKEKEQKEGSDRNKEMAETLSVVWRRRRRIGKDPTVDTNFLPDEDRDAQVLSERQRLIEEYQRIEAEARKEPLWVTYSFWDGTGHRRRTCVKKGSTVLQFLDQARSELEKEFVELRGLSAADLLYVKEDLILPHNTTFYDLIKTKARGKSGPLFTFNVHEDVRMVNDSRLEKADSHAGKVVERKWFERNKHIFPASRWEVYSPQKAYDTYTIHGGVHKWKGMSNSEIREAIV